MANQQDLYFAEYVIKLGYSSTTSVQEAFDILARLKKEADIEDTLSGVMLIKNFVSEKEVRSVHAQMTRDGIDANLELPISLDDEVPSPQDEDASLLRFYLEQTDGKEEAGDFAGAIVILNQARAYTSDRSSIDTKVNDLKRRLRDEERQARYQRYKMEVDRKARASDFEGAVTAAEIARDFSDDFEEMDSALSKLRHAALKKRERDAWNIAVTGDVEAAVRLMEGARAFARPEDVSRRVRELQQADSMRRSSDRYMAMADSYVRKGNAPAAIDIYRKLARIQTDPTALHGRIDSLQKEAFDAYMIEARKKEWIGDFNAAADISEKARQYTLVTAPVDRKISALRRRAEKAKKFRALRDEGARAVEMGDLHRGLSALSEAREFTENLENFQRYMDSLLVGKYESLLADAQAREREGDLVAALDAAREAKDFAPAHNAEEADERVRRLKDETTKGERNLRFMEIVGEAEELAEQGEARKAIDRLKAAGAFTSDTADVDGRIDAIVSKQYEAGLARMEKLRADGKLDDALGQAEELAPWARGREDDLRKRIGELQDQVQQRKKKEDFENSTKRADELLAQGNVPEALLQLHIASEWEEQKKEIESRVASIIDREFDKGKIRAQELSDEGRHNEAAELCREMRRWAKGREDDLDALTATFDKLREDTRSQAAFQTIVEEARKLFTAEKWREGVRKLYEAQDIEPEEGDVERRVDEVLQGRKEEALTRLRERMEEGDFVSAENCLAQAAEWAMERKEDFDTQRRDFDREIDLGRKHWEYELRLEDAETLLKTNSTKKALRKLDEARTFTDDHENLDARMEEIRNEAISRHLEEAKRLEQEEDFKWAVVSCELAKEYASDEKKEEIDGRIRALRERTETKESADAFEKVRHEAIDLREEGWLGEAIERYLEVKGLAEDPDKVTQEVASWKEEEVQRLLQRADEMKGLAKFDEALNEARKAVEWDVTERSREVVDSLQTEARADARRRKFDDTMTTVDAFLAEEEVWKAVDALKEARESAPDDFDVDQRVSQILLERYMGLVESARGALRGDDYESALPIIDSAREFAEGHENELAEEAERIREEVDRRNRLACLNEFMKTADQLLAEGNPSAAIEELAKALPFADSSEDIDNEIERVKSEEYARIAGEAEQKEDKGAYEDALALLESAREWSTGREDDLDSKVEALVTTAADKERVEAFRRRVDEAEERYKQGDVTSAIESLRFAAEVPHERSIVQRRINEMSEATFKKFIEEARVRSEAGGFEEALESCGLAREWAHDRASELDELEKELHLRIESRERTKRWTDVEADVRARVGTGDVLGAVELIKKNMELAPDPEEAQAYLEELKEKEYKDSILKARRLADEGRVDRAVEIMESARPWAKGRENELEAEIEALHRNAEASKRLASFRKLEKQALEAEEKGEHREAMEMWDLTRIYAEDPSFVDTRRANIRGRAVEESLTAAEKCENKMDFEGVVIHLRNALGWTDEEKKKDIEHNIERISGFIRMEKSGDRLGRLNVGSRGLLGKDQVAEALQRYETNLEIGGADEDIRKRIDDIAQRYLQRYAESIRQSLNDGDWTSALRTLDDADRLVRTITQPGEDLATLVAEVEAVKKDAEFLRCRSRAMESARDGDIKSALGFCEEAKVFADDPEVLEAAMISLVDTAFQNWIAEKEKFEEDQDWEGNRRVSRHLSELFDFEENITKNIWEHRESILDAHRTAEFRYSVNTAAQEEKKGNLLRSIELLREGREFSPDPSVVSKEIDRLQLSLFEKFNIDLARAEADEGVEGAIRFCKAALDYFPEQQVVRKRLEEYSDRWKLKERRSLFVQYDRAATSAISAGDMPAAVENYLAAAELSTDPQSVHLKIRALLEPVEKETLAKALASLEEGRLEEAIQLCEEAFQFYPSSKVLKEKCIALRKKHIDATSRTPAHVPTGEAVSPSNRWKAMLLEDRPKEDLPVSETDGPGILTSVWETGEFRAEDLFPGGMPGKTAEEVPAAEEQPPPAEVPVEEPAPAMAEVPKDSQDAAVEAPQISPDERKARALEIAKKLRKLKKRRRKKIKAAPVEEAVEEPMPEPAPPVEEAPAVEELSAPVEEPIEEPMPEPAPHEEEAPAVEEPPAHVEEPVEEPMPEPAPPVEEAPAVEELHAPVEEPVEEPMPEPAPPVEEAPAVEELSAPVEEPIEEPMPEPAPPEEEAPAVEELHAPVEEPVEESMPEPAPPEEEAPAVEELHAPVEEPVDEPKPEPAPPEEEAPAVEEPPAHVEEPVEEPMPEPAPPVEEAPAVEEPPAPVEEPVEESMPEPAPPEEEAPAVEEPPAHVEEPVEEPMPEPAPPVEEAPAVEDMPEPVERDVPRTAEDVLAQLEREEAPRDPKTPSMSEVLAKLPQVEEPKQKKKAAAKKAPKIPVKCPECGFKISVPISHAGKKGRCPKCKAVVKIPLVKGLIRCKACGKVATAKGAAKVKGKPVCAACVAKIKAKRKA